VAVADRCDRYLGGVAVAETMGSEQLRERLEHE
jgi:hypothetical protein